MPTYHMQLTGKNKTRTLTVTDDQNRNWTRNYITTEVYMFILLLSLNLLALTTVGARINP